MPEPKRTFDEVPVGQPMTFTVQRGHTEPERTFSPDAIRAMTTNLIEFILTQVAKQWEQAGKPPTELSVTVQCEVS